MENFEKNLQRKEPENDKEISSEINIADLLSKFSEQINQIDLKELEELAKTDKDAQSVVDVINRLPDLLMKETKRITQEVKPEKRNFLLELEENKDEVKIILKSKDGRKTTDLSSHLPEGWKFKASNEFACVPNTKEIEFIKERMSHIGFLLSLGHEVGHANEKKEHVPYLAITKTDLLKAAMGGIFNIIKGIRIKKEEENKKTIYKISTVTTKDIMPQWFIDKMSKVESQKFIQQAKSERNAWAFALKSLRYLEKEGFDVFSEFNNQEEMENYITYCLMTYEMNYFENESDEQKHFSQYNREKGKESVFLKGRKFKPNSDNNIEKLQKTKEKETNFEVLKTPEISVNEEPNAQLLSFILKAKNPEWGTDDTALSVDLKNYFLENPLDSKVSGFLDEIRALQQGGVDEEVLYTLAFTYGHPERNAGAFEVITKHKSYIENPQELQQKLFQILESFDQSFSSSPLAEKLNAEIEKDKKARGEILDETKARIEKLIAFFKPDSKTTGVRKISLMPTDPLDRVNTGSAFVFGEELVLKTHIDNPDNLEHEFSHSVINPIVEKLSQQLTDEQKEKISKLANEKLKQDYGGGYFSLLCEEFIRTYNDVFKKGEQLQTYETFAQKISGISEEQFQKFLTESKSFKARCEELGITTVEDFKNKSQEYFERFERNQLRDLIFEIYQEYSSRPDKETENFERFVLEKFSARI
jgi:hypothetical protein